MRQLSVKVVNKVLEAENIVSLELASLDGQPLPAFSAGSHIDVQVRPDGLIRQYSLLNDPAEQDRYIIGVLRDPESRGGSIAVHDTIKEGDTLSISEPRNHFGLVQAKRTVLLAGGIGVTPLLCMARRLSTIGGNFEMHYCARTLERMAFHEAITRSSFADKVHFHFDNGPDEQKLKLENIIAKPEADTHIYVCGPAGFIDFVLKTAKDFGWPDGQVHREYFGAVETDTTGDFAFEVKIASTGQVFSIPVDERITNVLEANGIFVPVSCEEGVCGTCLTRVLEGTPDHRDLYLTDAEHEANDQFTPCCSRSKTPMLVLDI